MVYHDDTGIRPVPDWAKEWVPGKPVSLGPPPGMEDRVMFGEVMMEENAPEGTTVWTAFTRIDREIVQRHLDTGGELWVSFRVLGFGFPPVGVGVWVVEGEKNGN